MNESFEDRSESVSDAALETELIEKSYLSLGDGEAFDDMLASWTHRLESIKDPNAIELETPKLKKHLNILKPLLEQFSDAISPDSFKQHIVAAQGPAALATPDGRVVCTNPKAQVEWDLWTGKKSEFDLFVKEASDDWIALKRSASGAGNRMHGILKMRSAAHENSFCIVSVIAPSTGYGRLLKIEKISFQWSNQMADLLETSFDFTASELDICQLLLGKPVLKQVAEVRGSSLATVKKQVRTIFSKTGTKSQIELVRLLSSLSSQLNPKVPEMVMSWHDPLDREFICNGENGDRIAISWMGAENGRPALLVHGPMTGNLLPAETDEMLRDQGIKLYLLSRPGFGNSSNSLNSCAVAAGSHAIGVALDHLGIDRCCLIGLVGGIIPAAHYAATNPNRVSGLLSLGSCFPIPQIKDRTHLPYHHRAFLGLVKYAPLVSEFLVRHAHRGAKYGGAEFILRRVYRDSEIDRRVLFSPEILPYSFAAVSLLMANGYETFLKDQSLLIYPWDRLLPKIGVPIVTIAGEKDPVFPLSQQLAIASQYSNWQIVKAENGSQTICFSHVEQVHKIMTEMILRAG